MGSRKMLDGNAAAVEGMRLARVQVVATYPITPQSPIAELLASLISEGALPGKYIRVESEHSALAAVIGAALTGARAGTATSSVGLALMHEVLGVAAGCRVPVVMPVVNRALVAPWSLWCDHQDAMAVRDSGWLQLYVQDAQEVLDLLLIAYRLAEDHRVLLPAMVCMDGFFVSHATMPVNVPEQECIEAFLPPYQLTNLRLDPADPMFINDLTPPEDFLEMRYQQVHAFSRALAVFEEIADVFAACFGRRYETVTFYSAHETEIFLVTMGSVTGTARYVAEKFRARGQNVGVVGLRSFRPFPAREIAAGLQNACAVGILDRSVSLGGQAGPLFQEVASALTRSASRPLLVSFLAGLGGRDIRPTDLEGAFTILQQVAAGHLCVTQPVWLGLRPDAEYIRGVVNCAGDSVAG